MLEMIAWMRDHNEAGGDVGFHGFDMQAPGMALHNVREYVREVDPEAVAAVSSQLECLEQFANDVRGRRPTDIQGYDQQPDSYRTECAADPGDPGWRAGGGEFRIAASSGAPVQFGSATTLSVAPSLDRSPDTRRRTLTSDRGSQVIPSGARRVGGHGGGADHESCRESAVPAALAARMARL